MRFEVMQRFRISGVPVTKNGRLVGILTNRDLRFETRYDLPIEKVMTKENLITVAVGTTLEEAEAILHRHRVEKSYWWWTKHYMLKGLITVKDIQKKLKYPNAAKDPQGRLRVGAALGSSGDFLERAQELVKKKVDVLGVDSAHGHSSRVMDAIKAIKKAFPEVDLVALRLGGDVRRGSRSRLRWAWMEFKVGIGPGSICTTRGSQRRGRASDHGHFRMRQGGERHGRAGDRRWRHQVFGRRDEGDRGGRGFGDDQGSLLAGTEESPGETILYQGRTFKSYRGMGSMGALAQGTSNRYDQDPSGKLVPEGIEGRVPYKGMLADLVYQLVGGLRAGMGYCGCATIQDLRERGRFVRVTSAGLKESHVHDVIITKEAPNYRLE